MPSGSSSDVTFVGSWRTHQIVAEILSSPAAEQNRIIEVACGNDQSLRSRVKRMLASMEGATADPSFELAPSDSLHGTGDLVLSRKIMFSATRETWAGHRRDDCSSRVLIHVFPSKNSSFDSVVSAFESCQNISLEQLVSHGVTPGCRAFVAFNRVNGVPINQYLSIFTTSSDQRAELFDRIRHAIVCANDAGLHHEALTSDSIMISEIDGKPLPTIVGLGLHRLAFSGVSSAPESDLLVAERILKELEQDFGTHAVSGGGALLACAPLGVMPVPGVVRPFFSGNSSPFETFLSMMRGVVEHVTRQSVLGLTLLSLMVLTYLCSDFEESLADGSHRAVSAVTSSTLDVQVGSDPIASMPGGGSIDPAAVEHPFVPEKPVSKRDGEIATLRMTPERQSASSGGADFGVR